MVESIGQLGIEMPFFAAHAAWMRTALHLGSVRAFGPVGVVAFAP